METPNMLLRGRVAVVTGGGRGLGASIARGLAEHGAMVAVVDRDPAGAEAVTEALVSDSLRAVAVTADVVDATSCANAVAAASAELGPLSILVNCAGVIDRIRPEDTDFGARVQRLLSVNAVGTANMVAAALPDLKQTAGCIVNVASVASFRATPGGSGYAASKGAVLQLTRSLAAELATSGIRVNAIAPGPMETEMTAEVRNDQERAQAMLEHIPLGRFGRPDEAVGPVVFLASDLATYVTGATLPVDGGYLTL
ncbi:SDR family NAD(P)-dependent oxidoreductase [Kribbella yunnanensis]|uniref:SDR family NAD(P)-dependent oxidoreductase n=1 Tax=Kribbella yunnanensis TaxID=190194 RepID=A0ABN2IL47_9ACTN